MRESIHRWMTFASEDLRVAELAYQERIYNQVCFHARQCVEKTLKGLIAAGGEVPPRTHSITDLLSLVSVDLFQDIRDALSWMDDFYIPTRYPDALPGTLPDGLPGRQEAEEALDLARVVFDRVKEWIEHR